MKMSGSVWIGLAVFSLALASLALAAEKGAAPDHKYIGSSKCAKLCHASAKQGKQLDIWKNSKHAKAYETLLTDEAKATAKKAGLTEPPEKSAECLKCHVTGHDVPAEFFDKGFKMEDGIQCESCHGPGEKYQKLAVMKDREKALAQGLIIGDKELCLQCHNDTAPSWDPNRYTTKDGKKVGFDYEQLWPQIAHPKPKD